MTATPALVSGEAGTGGVATLVDNGPLPPRRDSFQPKETTMHKTTCLRIVLMLIAVVLLLPVRSAKADVMVQEFITRDIIGTISVGPGIGGVDIGDGEVTGTVTYDRTLDLAPTPDLQIIPLDLAGSGLQLTLPNGPTLTAGDDGSFGVGLPALWLDGSGAFLGLDFQVLGLSAFGYSPPVDLLTDPFTATFGIVDGPTLVAEGTLGFVAPLQVPEPATAGLLLAGLAVAAGMRSRRRHR